MFNWFKKKEKVKVGDILVCVDDRDWGRSFPQLKYGEKYKVLNLLVSPCRDKILCVDFGSKVDPGEPNQFTKCTACKKEIPGSGIHWAKISRFRKATKEEIEEFEKNEKLKIIQNKYNLQEALKKSISSEDYESAQILKEEIEKQNK